MAQQRLPFKKHILIVSMLPPIVSQRVDLGFNYHKHASYPTIAFFFLLLMCVFHILGKQSKRESMIRYI